MDEVSTLKDMAIMLHEAYKSYVEAGFTKAQSLDLVKHMMTMGQ